MNRKLGVCTWTFGPRPIAEIATRVASLGYDGVELHGDLQAFRPKEVGSLMRDHGLEVFSLTPDNVDPATADAAVRAAALDYYRRLVDFAAAIGGAIVSFHGLVGRIAPLASMAEEEELLARSLRSVCEHARSAGVRVVYEVLNRYESHLVNTGQAALALIERIGADNLFVLLDAYHMNIEEAAPAQAIRAVGRRLGLFHVADSNREGIGRGHSDFAGIVGALDTIGYRGPVIVECTAAGANPFTPVKPGDYLGVLEGYLATSRDWLRAA
jgi:D-psicose/D-tagatose/L-ribulose 3-epimerase